MTALTNIFNNFWNPYFIETGTCFGDGVQLALDARFENIFSIELSYELYALSVKRFMFNKDVKIIHGDSTEVLWDLIKNINYPITFWLDAHYSGGASGNKIITAHNNKVNTPILDELDIIEKHKIKTHTILIDDMSFFGGLPIIDLLNDINKDYKISFLDGIIKNDILVASID